MEEVDVAGSGSSTEGGAPGFEILGTGTIKTETVESDTSEIETSGIASPIAPEYTGNAEPSPDGRTESVNPFGPAVVLDSTNPCLDLAEEKDLATETRLDVFGNISESESRHGETNPLHFRPDVDHRIETEAETNVIDASQDPAEHSEQDISSGCCFVSSIPEAVPTSAFANEHQKNAEEDEEAARVKFEPGKMLWTGTGPLT